jgi:transposase-like protein
MVSIQGRHIYHWRAVGSEGEVLDILIQPKRDKAAALTLLRKLLKKQGYAPRVLVTDKLRSLAARDASLASQPAMSRACARTTGPRTRTRRYGGESARRGASSRLERKPTLVVGPGVRDHLPVDVLLPTQGRDAAAG